MKNKHIFYLFLLLAVGCSPVKKTAEGVVVKTEAGEKVRVEAVSDKILRVSATVDSKFSSRPSLVVVPRSPSSLPKFTVTEDGSSVSLATAEVTAKIDKKTGAVSFFTKEGEQVLAEDRRCFSPIEVDSDKGYSFRQVFYSPDDEAFYGLGQHQSDEFNYKGRNETLYQYNTKVSNPTIVSNKGYGIYWDNYSLTRWGNPLDYSNLDELFVDGGLTGRYMDADGKVIVERFEKTIDFSDLEKAKNLPQMPRGMMFGRGGKTIYEGDLTPKESGIYNFILYYANYVKVSVDGEEVVPVHWRTSWNANSVKFPVEMTAGTSRHFKVEVDGSVSYLSLKALAPVDPAEQAKMSWWSEMGDMIDYYFIWGGTPDGVVSGYRTLTGKAPIMPKWVMGYWQSRERYKTQDEIVGAVKEYRDRHIGLDNIVMDWSHWVVDQWGSHVFDPERFPNPKQMVDTIHSMHAKYMVSVWPKFYASTEHFKELDAIGAMYQTAIRDSVLDFIRPGYLASFYDAYNPAGRELFWKQIEEHYLSLGIDAWWMDASEPDILSNASMDYRKALSGPTYLGSSTRYFNTYALVNADAIYNGQRKSLPNQRVFLLTRSGFAGLQRYSTATWSGDIGSCWEDMKAQISAGLNFSISGIPFWSQDIGGFTPQNKFYRMEEGSENQAEWREMNVRWHQWGAFTPMYRSHGSGVFREIYNIAPEGHPAYKALVAANALRYRLMPYLYTMAARAYFEDYTLMRPLVMDFTDDKTALNISDEFMFGDAFLVCPVYEYKARSREVYLPNGYTWYDFHTGKAYEGGQTIQAAAPYEYSPLFVRSGQIVVMGNDIEYTDMPNDNAFFVTIYAGQDGYCSVYEDEGVNYNYEKGAFTNIPMTWNDSEGMFSVGDREGSFEGMPQGPRAIQVTVVSANGSRTAELSYEGKSISIKL